MCLRLGIALLLVGLAWSFIYMCTPRKRGLGLSRVFLLYRGDNRIHAYSTKHCTVLGLG
jgi:hypothetical protein